MKQNERWKLFSKMHQHGSRWRADKATSEEQAWIAKRRAHARGMNFRLSSCSVAVAEILGMQRQGWIVQTTKKRSDSDSLVVTLHSPTSKRRGLHSVCLAEVGTSSFDRRE